MERQEPLTCRLVVSSGVGCGLWRTPWDTLLVSICQDGLGRVAATGNPCLSMGSCFKTVFLTLHVQPEALWLSEPLPLCLGPALLDALTLGTHASVCASRVAGVREQSTGAAVMGTHVLGPWSDTCHLCPERVAWKVTWPHLSVRGGGRHNAP